MKLKEVQRGLPAQPGSEEPAWQQQTKELQLIRECPEVHVGAAGTSVGRDSCVTEHSVTRYVQYDLVASNWRYLNYG